MLHIDVVKHAFCRFNAAKCATHGAPRPHHEMARAWRARGAFRRAETADMLGCCLSAAWVLP
eukprot:4731228-Lingulodinium_polyedra.AAC.1